MRRKLKYLSRQLVVVALLMLPEISADAFVTMLPSTDYTTFENNTSTFTFNCSGDGTELFWTVDGQAATTSYVLSRGIYYTPPVSPDGVTVSSQLIVPTTKANNNTVVICTVLDTSYHHFQSSDPVRLILQGILPPPLLLGISSSNSTITLSWVAPPSLEVSTPPTISHYILDNNVTNIPKTISNPAVCKPAMPCTSSLDINDPSFMISAGEQNTTILDYNGTIEFTFFAVNGAGDGNANTYTYVHSKLTTGYMYVPTTQCAPTAGNNATGGINTPTRPILVIAIVVPAVAVVAIATAVVVPIIVMVMYRRKKNVQNSEEMTRDARDMEPHMPNTQQHLKHTCSEQNSTSFVFCKS